MKCKNGTNRHHKIYQMPNMWKMCCPPRDAFHNDTRCDEREFQMYCWWLRAGAQNEECSDGASRERSWYHSTKAISLSSSGFQMWTIPEKISASSPFEEEASGGKILSRVQGFGSMCRFPGHCVWSKTQKRKEIKICRSLSTNYGRFGSSCHSFLAGPK